MLVGCDECGKEFDKLPSQIKRTKHNFCSRSCAGTFGGKMRHGPYGNEERKTLYDQARLLRRQNLGYRTIGNMLNIPWKTISNWVSDISVDAAECKKNATNRMLLPISELSSKDAIRKRLLELRGYQCEWCKITEWQGREITLELHHIDGNSENHRLENLVLLCPNCHSQTDNYRNKSRK